MHVNAFISLFLSVVHLATSILFYIYIYIFTMAKRIAHWICTDVFVFNVLLCKLSSVYQFCELTGVLKTSF